MSIQAHSAAHAWQFSSESNRFWHHYQHPNVLDVHNVLCWCVWPRGRLQDVLWAVVLTSHRWFLFSYCFPSLGSFLCCSFGVHVVSVAHLIPYIPTHSLPCPGASLRSFTWLAQGQYFLRHFCVVHCQCPSNMPICVHTPVTWKHHCLVYDQAPLPWLYNVKHSPMSIPRRWLLMCVFVYTRTYNTSAQWPCAWAFGSRSGR